MAMRLCACESASVISLVQRKLLRTCLPCDWDWYWDWQWEWEWDRNGMGWARAWDWVFGPPAAKHPHLLSSSSSSFIACSTPPCITAAAWQSESSSFQAYNYQLAPNHTYIHMHIHIAESSTMFGHWPVISFYCRDEMKGGLGATDPIRFEACNVDLFNQWQAKWILLQLHLLQINANEIIQTSFGTLLLLRAASIFVLCAHSQFACFENLIGLQFPQIKLNFSVALFVFGFSQPCPPRATKQFIFRPKTKTFVCEM